MWQKNYKSFILDVNSLFDEKQNDENTLDAFMCKCIGKPKSGVVGGNVENSISSKVEKILGPGYIINAKVDLNVSELTKPDTILREFFIRVSNNQHIKDACQKQAYNFPSIWSNSHLKYFQSNEEISEAAKNIAKSNSIIHKRELSIAISKVVSLEIDRIFLYYEPYITRVNELELRLSEILNECEQTVFYEKICGEPVEKSIYSFLECRIRAKRFELRNFHDTDIYGNNKIENLIYKIKSLFQANGKIFTPKWNESVFELIPLSEISREKISLLNIETVYIQRVLNRNGRWYLALNINNIDEHIIMMHEFFLFARFWLFGNFIESPLVKSANKF